MIIQLNKNTSPALSCVLFHLKAEKGGCRFQAAEWTTRESGNFPAEATDFRFSKASVRAGGPKKSHYQTMHRALFHS